MKPANPILIVDDQRTIQVIIAKMLKKAGYDHVVSCTDERDTINILENQEIEIILLDVVMPYISGDELLMEIRKKVPQIPVVMVTSQNDTATVVRCMRNGAYDYITKPIDSDLLVAAIERAIQFRELERQNLRLRNNLLTASPANKAFFEHIITGSSKMIALFKYCEAVAPGKEPVLITGETGTGKELMARAFHAASHRKGPFVAVNVAGVDDHVFSDTLFGHEKGAFTGADRPRHGFINKAQGGTLFLDEIGDLSEGSQIKLLRVIQENEFFALGSDRPMPTDARIIVATHKNLALLQESERFRKDLFFRLRTHHMEIPPLRERREDIGLLLDYFMKEAAKQFDKSKPTYPNELVQLLKVHDFPGNVRELRAMVFDAVARHTSKMLSTEVFSKYIFPTNRKSQTNESLEKEKYFDDLETLPTLKAAAEALIDEAMHRAGSNQKIAAAMLGITPPALNKRLKQRADKL
ncbi:MAG: sigma-54 dependent transcriptional regulator [Desulfobacteraceae bacterium]|jgi:DNA-binding NtrC family response regulator